MTINSTSPSVVLGSLQETSPEKMQMGVLMLKKEQEVMKAQGEAMIKMLEQIPAGGPQQGLDVYA